MCPESVENWVLSTVMRMLKVWPAMVPNHISELEARTKCLPEWDWCPSSHGKQFFSDKNDDMKKNGAPQRKRLCCPVCL